jgi:hypothetical protein
MFRTSRNRTARKVTLRGSIPALAAVGVMAAVGVGYAAIPGSDGMVSGCYGSTGQLRVIDAEAGAKCTKKETALRFSQTGPRGDACLPTTPACVGPRGADGINGINGTDGKAGKDGQSCSALNPDGSLAQPACRGPQGPAGNLGIQSVGSVGDQNSDGQKVQTVYCPSGKMAISGGAQVLGWTNGLSGDSVAINSIDVFNGASGVSGVSVAALEVGGGTTNTWALYATGVCVAVAG